METQHFKSPLPFQSTPHRAQATLSYQSETAASYHCLLLFGLDKCLVPWWDAGSGNSVKATHTKSRFAILLRILLFKLLLELQ